MDKLGVESGLEIDRCHRVGPRKKKAKVGTDNTLLFTDWADLKIRNIF